LVEGHSTNIRYRNVHLALQEAGTDLRLFGKPELAGKRRMGVALAIDDTIDAAVEKALRSADAIDVALET
jgi:phosphoribosylglycinamide formyltransferase 2